MKLVQSDAVFLFPCRRKVDYRALELDLDDCSEVEFRFEPQYEFLQPT